MSDDYLKNMLDAKNSRAVLKMELTKLRASIQNTLIIAMEGKDDKPIYAQWIRRLQPGLTYEPFACGGKKRVLALKSAVEADLNNLADKVFFLIDRDFDELQGGAPSSALFMTDSYSVENYLVESGVLEEILTNHLECHAQPGLRRDIIEQFERRYEEFLACMRDVNKRIFLARRLKINVLGGIPKKINDFVTVRLESIEFTGLPASDFVKLEREPTAEEIEIHTDDFNAMDAKSRHRGKFAMLFLMKWIELLAQDRLSENSTWFAQLKRNCKINLQGISSGIMATTSPMPVGLADFLQQAA